MEQNKLVINLNSFVNSEQQKHTLLSTTNRDFEKTLSPIQKVAPFNATSDSTR